MEYLYNQSTNPSAALDALKDDSPDIDEEITETIVDSATGGDNSDTEDSQKRFEVMPRHVIYTSSEAAEDHEPPCVSLKKTL